MKRKACDTHGLLHDHRRDEEGSTGAQVTRKASAPEKVAGGSADGGHNQVRELFLHQGQQPGRGDKRFPYLQWRHDPDAKLAHVIVEMK